jgi:inhibitor of KinA sporulation pathway (predicted exonuclease)
LNFISLDLEFTQPSCTIIQIGAVIFDPKSGQIIDRFSRIVHTTERITPYIIELTGITQEQVDKGMDLKQAYIELCAFKKKHKAHKQTVTWGTGDVRALKEQVIRKYQITGEELIWEFGLRDYDIKTIFQAMRLAKGESTKAGLGTAMQILGMTFEGRAHDALVDAENTANVFTFLMKKLRSI